MVLSITSSGSPMRGGDLSVDLDQGSLGEPLAGDALGKLDDPNVGLDGLNAGANLQPVKNGYPQALHLAFEVPLE
jgi:hypothetical protein